jgi:hypothetical protein
MVRPTRAWAKAKGQLGRDHDSSRGSESRDFQRCQTSNWASDASLSEEVNGLSIWPPNSLSRAGKVQLQ